MGFIFAKQKQLKIYFLFSLIFFLAFIQSCTIYQDPKTGKIIKPEPATTSALDLNILFPKSEFALPNNTKNIRNIRRLVLSENTDFEELPDLLFRIRAGMKLPNLNSQHVDGFFKTYASQPSINRVLERAKYFLYDIVIELEKRDMPMEFALLPIIESSFITNSTSKANAVGIWQFIPSTADKFGLIQNEWLDERMDVAKSTLAALDFIEQLHEKFGSWFLALAAYNCGEGCVNKALKKIGGHYSKIPYDNLPLPKETLLYAPRLQALKEIFSDPTKFDIVLPHIPNKRFTQKIKIDVPIHSEYAAKLSGIKNNEFVFLNAKLKKDIYHPSMGYLFFPTESAFEFFEKLYDYEILGDSWSIHQVKPQESLQTIAKRYNSTIKKIKKVNPISKNSVKTASILIIPSTKRLPKIQVNELPKVTSNKDSLINKIYISKFNYSLKSFNQDTTKQKIIAINSKN